MARYGKGSHNKTHGRIEKHSRIDSFFFRNLLPMIGSKEFLKCGKINLYREYIENENGTILFARVPHEFGERVYFECPYCYHRFRYLYWHDDWYKCRFCAKLNYRSQQETKSNGDLSLYRIFKILEKLNAEDTYCWIDSAHYIPERPRYMHEKTYIRLIRKLHREQEIYSLHLMGMLRDVTSLIS